MHCSWEYRDLGEKEEEEERDRRQEGEGEGGKMGGEKRRGEEEKKEEERRKEISLPSLPTFITHTHTQCTHTPWLDSRCRSILKWKASFTADSSLYAATLKPASVLPRFSNAW